MPFTFSVKTKNILLLTGLGALLFFPGLGGVRLFDWDEINFAEISREMIVLGDYLRVHVNFKPFWEKPPLYFWMQAGAMHVFGIGEFAARFPNAINGILTLIVLYLIGCRLHNSRFGFFWALAYMGSVLPFLYAKSGIIDPWFNFFIFLGLYGFVLFYWKKDGMTGLRLTKGPWFYLLAGGLAIGLGILTKGPVAFLIAALTLGVYWVMKRFRWYAMPWHFLAYTLAAATVMLVWYGLETWKNGPWFITEFNKYQYRLFSTPDAGHRGFPGYHFVVLLVGVFPASVFAIRSFFPLENGMPEHRRDFLLWMKILFWVVLVLFTIVKSKIVHYSSMCYLPMTYMAAVVIQEWWEGRLAFNRWMQTGLIALGAIYALAVASLPLAGMHIEYLKPLFRHDPFGAANLEADILWTGWESIPAVVLAAVLFFSVRFFRTANLRWGIPFLFLGTAVFVMATLVAVIRKVEGYSQAAAMEFFEQRQGEDAYVRPVGYKTYGHLFYTRKPGLTRPESLDQDWLLTGPVDKPVYFVAKVHKTDKLQVHPEIREIGRKNGFVFYRREAVTNGQ